MRTILRAVTTRGSTRIQANKLTLHQLARTGQSTSSTRAHPVGSTATFEPPPGARIPAIDVETRKLPGIKTGSQHPHLCFYLVISIILHEIKMKLKGHIPVIWARHGTDHLFSSISVGTNHAANLLIIGVSE
jgi:hypothetical protein